MNDPRASQPSAELPVHRASSLNPYQRAPTLMAGQTAGMQGPVQVWAPETGRIRLHVAGWLSVSTAAAASLWVLHSVSFWNWLLAALPVWLAILVGLAPIAAAAVSAFYVANALMAIPALWKPSYVTVDDAGLGITSWRGSRAIAWGDLVAYARYRILHYVLLYTASGQVLFINSAGYSRKAIDEFCAMAAERARLEVTDRSVWRRALFGGSYSGRLRKGYRLAFSDRVVRERPVLPERNP